MSRAPLRKPINPVRRPGAPVAAPRRPPPPGARTARGQDEGYLYVAGVKDASKRVTEYRRDDDTCPVCHTDRQFSKTLRLLVSPCYHKMCEACIDRLFTLGPEPCPTCGKVLRKANFAHQTFEDLAVEKEVSVRRRIGDIYNMRREDFASDREYDDYLEEVEDITFNLLNDVDVAATEARIASYEASHASSIASNAARATHETLSQAEQDDVERRARAERRRMVEAAAAVEAAEERRVRLEVVDALATGGRAAAQAITDRAERAKAARAKALEAAVPPSLVVAPTDDDSVTDPTDPRYVGEYVPLPYADEAWRKWTTATRETQFVDGRSGVTWAKEDRDGKVRAGGWDLPLFWEMEVRAAVEALAV
ncbi:TFIIH/NER complex subunit [Cryptotrichosporon argae]